LSNANLSGANLSGSNLSGANLSGAILSNANLSKYLTAQPLSQINSPLIVHDTLGSNMDKAILTNTIFTGTSNIPHIDCRHCDYKRQPYIDSNVLKCGFSYCKKAL